MVYTRRAGDIVVVTPPVPVSDRAVDRLLSELVGYLRGEQPYALIFDLTKAEMPSALQRKKLSDHLRTHNDAIRRNVRVMALVAPSAALRGIATAVFWVSPPPIEWRVFELIDEATHWAKARCAP